MAPVPSRVLAGCRHRFLTLRWGQQPLLAVPAVPGVGDRPPKRCHLSADLL